VQRRSSSPSGLSSPGNDERGRPILQCMPDWDLPADTYLDVRTEPLGGKLYRLLDILTSMGVTGDGKLVGEPTRIVLYRRPSGPALLEFKYGTQAEQCAVHLASLQSRLNTLTLKEFCDDLGLPPRTLEYPHVQCQAHGWQESTLITRYRRRANPRDVPDHYLCIACAATLQPADVTNSIKVESDRDSR
jgi:hypothetical protein